MTREKLQELGLPEESLAPVLALWAEREQQLRLETEQMRAAGEEENLERSLREAGAHPALVPLLLRASAQEPDRSAETLRRAYPECFSREALVPLQETTPPLGAEGWSPQTLRTMSADEINRNWERVRTTLNRDAHG